MTKAALDRNAIKVCHFSSVHKIDDIRVSLKECQSLHVAGFKVSLIACVGNDPGVDFIVHGVPCNGGRVLRMLFRSTTVFRLALKQKADVYHFHDPELLLFGCLIKMITGKIVIFDSHECYREDLLNKEWMPYAIRKPVVWIYGLLEEWSVRYLDLIVAATPYIGERLRAKARRCIVVNNYPVAEEFNADDSETDSYAERRNGVCYIGAISIIRGLVPFLDSIDQLDDGIVVRMAGTFASGEIRDFANNHRNWHRVKFYGQVDRRIIRDILSQSFAGIVNFLPAPNHEYSQPNKLFEYMAAGVPVVCSDFPVWVDIVGRNECGIPVEPSSSNDIACAIRRLFSDKNLAMTMGGNGVKAVREQYSWGCQAGVLVKTYGDLLASSRR